ncbi:hypothetical protein BpHYR1_023960 [Brachionus plicatilis]|uniref:Uncharacterized protein n=1 Tax=Brachionus plicatilis TaxID=10195 RepID=A0A3M7SPW6_BRAPC|nr:hypothetical protein BpHYR1_023960 [Brachionus plicatilis]
MILKESFVYFHFVQFEGYPLITKQEQLRKIDRIKIKFQYSSSHRNKKFYKIKKYDEKRTFFRAALVLPEFNKNEVQMKFNNVDRLIFRHLFHYQLYI